MSAAKKIVLVTGGNAGLGFAIVKLLIADGSFHVLMGSRSVERGTEALKDIQSQNLPGSAEVIELDVAKEDTIARAAKYTQDKFGRLDALVNNAGLLRGEGSTADQMLELFKTNALGPALMTEHFSPLLKAVHDTTRIVHVTSGAGSLTSRMQFEAPFAGTGTMAYWVSKAAQNMVFGNQAYQLRESNVKSFLYGPGPTQSRGNTIAAFKTAEEGVQPVIEILKGERDQDENKFLHHGLEGGIAPW